MGRRSCHWMARKLGGGGRELSLGDQDADGEEICHWVARKLGGGSFHWETRILTERRSVTGWPGRWGDLLLEDQDADGEEKLSLDGVLFAPASETPLWLSKAQGPGY